MTALPDIQTMITVNCLRGQHEGCEGYIAPLVYSDTRICECDCHGLRGRDFAAAVRKAEASYYPKETAPPGGD